MIITLDAKNRIRGTSACWQLEEMRQAKDESRWIPYKYFATFGQALTAAAQRELRTDPAQTITEALRACDRVTQKYARLFDAAGNREVAA